MGYQDSAMKAFFSDSYVFADVFNYWLYDGAQILEAENFKEASESLISFSSKQKNRIGMSKESVETETPFLSMNNDKDRPNSPETAPEPLLPFPMKIS